MGWTAFPLHFNPAKPVLLGCGLVSGLHQKHTTPTLHLPNRAAIANYRRPDCRPRPKIAMIIKQIITEP